MRISICIYFMQCQTPNPYFEGQPFALNTAQAVAAMFGFPLNDGTVECVECHYINIGNDIPSMCDWKKENQNFINILSSL